MADFLSFYGVAGIGFCIFIWFTCHPDKDWGYTSIFFYGLLSIIIWPIIALYMVFRMIQAVGEQHGKQTKNSS